MSRADWLRTFVAVYRAGSVTSGARARGISQPAASQQLAALSRAAGAPVLARTRDGVAPTSRGLELYAQVAESLDRLESVLADLDGGRISTISAPTRIGSSADLFEGYALPRIAAWPAQVSATFAAEADLFTQLVSGEVDLTVTLGSPGRRPALETRVVGERRFLLVAATHAAPVEPLLGRDQIALWLTGRAWVSYSHEVPLTRRFWASHLGKTFDADVRLVAPDLRSVVAAVKLGMGSSLVPDYACRRELTEGSVVEICDVGDFVSGEPIYCSLRRADKAHEELQRFLQLLGDAQPFDVATHPRA
jgi:DNA-binding transcriptional LysR family regulator